MATNFEGTVSPDTSVLFLGSKSLGFRLFQNLYEQDSSINWTVVHPDDSQDSRSQLQIFQEYCTDRGINFLIGSSKTLLRDTIDKHLPRIAIVCGWYSILSDEILSLVPSGFWGIHHSLLPKYRGSAPLVWAIINGDEYLGSTIFKFDENVDSGPILSQVKIKISQQEDISTIIARLEKLVLEEFSEYWPTLLDGNVEVIAQNNVGASYGASRVEIDSKIDWKLSAKEINNHVRAQQNPYPTANSYWNGQNIQVLKCTLLDAKYFGAPGQIVAKSKEGIIVACGENSGILITELKLGDRCLIPSDFPFHLKTRFKDI